MSAINVESILTEYRQLDDDQQRSDCLKRLLTYDEDLLKQHDAEIADTISPHLHTDRSGLRHRIIRTLRTIGFAVATDELGYVLAVVR